MDSIRRIRKEIFDATQEEFGTIAGVPQATVSRWESGQLSPNLTDLERIRKEALKRGLKWDDSLFFGSPSAKRARAA